MAETTDSDQDPRVYRVVVNVEEQYSIWPVDKELPLGWEDVGFSGPRSECLTHVSEIWTDMRPKSVREKMKVERHADG